MSANEDPDDPAYIFEEWHERVRNRDVEELLKLSAPDVVLDYFWIAFGFRLAIRNPNLV